MIEAELRSVPAGGREYVPVARIRVEDDGTSRIWDPDQLLPLDVHALVPSLPGEFGETGPRRVTFADDPQLWVRRLDTILRTGYLVPVVLQDDEGDIPRA